MSRADNVGLRERRGMQEWAGERLKREKKEGKRTGQGWNWAFIRKGISPGSGSGLQFWAEREEEEEAGMGWREAERGKR